MTRSKKIWLGIFTFLPVLGMIVYIIFFALYFFSFTTMIDHNAGSGGEPNPAMMIGSFGIMFIAIMLSVISGLVMMIYYIIHANSNPNFDSNQKLIWILILVLANGIGNVIYYFVEILPANKTPTLSKE